MSNSELYDVFATVESTLPAGTLRFQSLTGEERLGQIYEYVLDVWTLDEALDFKQLSGTDISLRLSDGQRDRRFNGVCVGLEEDISGHHADGNHVARAYRLRLQPWFGFHRHIRDNRVFEFGETAPKPATDVFTAVAGEAATTPAPTGKIGRSFDADAANVTVHPKDTPPRPLYVQYRESSLDFLSRLLERDGMTWWFEHLDDCGVKIHICNATAHYEAAAADPLTFRGNEGDKGVEGISELRRIGTATPGAHVGLAHDWTETGSERVKGLKEAAAGAHADWRQSSDGMSSYEYISDPAPAKVADLVSFISEAAAARSTRLEGTTNSLAVCAGHRLNIDWPGSDETLPEQLVTATRVQVSSRETYGGTDDAVDDGVRVEMKCSFESIPADVPFRVPAHTAVPSPAGPQSALVVGVSGDEITGDKDLRIQVRFQWDARTADDKHVCWVRVAQPLAGAGFGTHFIPRQGMEVIVDFVDGQVDQPIVTGCLYNGRNAPAFPMPASANVIGLRSHSTKEGNEETFSAFSIDDTKDAEVMEVVAERDFRREVGNNDVLEIGLIHTDEGNQTITIQNNRTVTLNEGTDALTITMGDRTADIEDGSDTLTIANGDRTTDIAAGSDALTITQGDRTTDIAAGADTLTVKKAITVTSQDDSIIIDGSKKVTIDAGDEITLTCGSASIKLQKTGDITIKGKAVKITGTGNIDIESSANFTGKGMAAKLDGTTAEVSGSGGATIKGATVNIN